ncbi:hypothetical protein AT727_08875 [Desulfitobacterium hafniense]|uniref:CRISPR system ring nuclease SSO1393-like domain-containing protein n=1 Tax=Desulfitobacterium hafniense TaxID=49338 RepID=A0A0W1JG47_DESHA|nr:hypothetical protein [Desulfitobacterium hafniense]KTE90031.1 hypothetical protein AT727_08875 [Desulfitobacterium hafniense]
MMRVMTMVGASIFTNYIKEKPGDIDAHFKQIENSLNWQWDDQLERIKPLKDVLSSWVKKNNTASAEIKSILKIQKEVHDNILVQLVATDTILSRLAAEIIRDELQGKIINNCQISVIFDPENDVIKNLQIRNRKLFEKEGVSRLARYLDAQGFGNGDLFNITGGYKALIPYLSIIGMLKNIPLYYIFEDTDELIKIPQMPVDINWGLFEKYVDIFEKLDEGLEEDWAQFKRRNNLEPEFPDCIWQDEGLVGLNSVWDILWHRFKEHILVKVPKESNQFYSEQPGNLKEVIEATRELYQRLDNEIKNNALESQEGLLKHIESLGTKHDLRHGENLEKNIFIFKSTDKAQIRIVYQPEFIKNYLSIKIYKYLRGSFDHTRYISEFRKRYKFQRAAGSIEFITIPIKKC